MMAALIRQLCALSVFCGVASSLTPAGAPRRNIRFVCAVAILACVLSGIGKLDLDEYSLATAQIRERERAFLEQSEANRKSLERRVIESECAAYIWDKAGALGIPLQGVDLIAQWSTDGVWVPYSVRIRSTAGEEERRMLEGSITADLGIPPERQEWIRDG